MTAAAQGLTLEGWLRQIVGREVLAADAIPKKSAYGLFKKYGPGPPEDEIDENRREMFRGFAGGRSVIGSAPASHARRR